MLEVLVVITKSVCILVSVLLAVAFMTVGERKYLSSIQRSSGPNVIGVFGLLQAIGDGLNLLSKEGTFPSNIDMIIFICSPIMSFLVGISAYALLPSEEGVVLSDLPIGLMYLLALSSLSVYGVLFGGWSSNSKYSLLGGLRSSAQMISYEVSIIFLLASVVLYGGGSLNLSDLVLMQEGCWYVISLFPLFLMFLISILAETNSHPFDLPEAESELVSGYNVDYSGMTFALFFLAEYGSIISMSWLTAILFLGGWSFGLSWKVFLVIVFFIFSSGAFPSYSFDQLLLLSWESLLPLSLSSLLLVVMTVYVF